MTFFVVVGVATVTAFLGFVCGVLWAFVYMDEYDYRMSEAIRKGLACAD